MSHTKLLYFKLIHTNMYLLVFANDFGHLGLQVKIENPWQVGTLEGKPMKTNVSPL